MESRGVASQKSEDITYRWVGVLECQTLFQIIQTYKIALENFIILQKKEQVNTREVYTDLNIKDIKI